MINAEIAINNLRAVAIIGFNPEERIEKQEVIINISFNTDIEKAVSSDSPENIIDYKVLKKKVLTFVENSNFNLLETLAQRTLELVLSEKNLLSAKVRVDKPYALRFADSASVTVSGVKEK